MIGGVSGAPQSGYNATSLVTERPAESVTVRDNVPLDAAPRRFMRVRVTSP